MSTASLGWLEENQGHNGRFSEMRFRPSRYKSRRETIPAEGFFSGAILSQITPRVDRATFHRLVD